MMRISYVGLIICYTITLTRSDRPLGIEFITRCRSNSRCEILQTSESRYQSKDPHSEYANRDYAKKKGDLPGNFRASNYAAYDYLGYKEQQEPQQQDKHRRTFFEDTFYNPQDKRTPYPRAPDFYQFVTSMFGIRGEPTTRPEAYRYDRNHATFYEPPGSYNFRPTQPNYIPPPKPIRASVIKLETITRSPNLYPSFDHDTGKFYQNFGNILNPVIIQNSKNSQRSNFHDSSQKFTSSTGVSFPVLSQPLTAPPTTLKPPPEFPIFFSDQLSTGLSYLSEYSNNRNRTDYKYPDSVQDKLPPIDFVRTPYFLTTFVPSVTTTFPPKILPTSNYDENFFSPTDAPNIYTTTKSSTNLIDIRTLSHVNTENRQQSLIEIGKIKNFEFDATTFKSLDKSVQKVSEPLKNSILKLNPSNKTSVEIITNLTVEGLLKGKNENANIQNHVNYFNVRNLINYEMNKLKSIPERDRYQKNSGNDSQAKNDEELSHLVNLYDELSLDAKILKDTNWDGFSTTPLNLTVETHPIKLFLNRTQIQVETIPNSQSNQQFRFKPISNSRINETKAKKDFWESDVVTGKTIPEDEITTTLKEKTTTEKLELPTTTEIPSFSTVFETTERTELMTSPEDLTTQNENLESIKAKDTSEKQTTTELLNKTTTEIPTSREMLKTNLSPESTTPYFQKRKYSRRAKFLNYTPYTTSTTLITTELPKKVFNRNNFPRRQKPNITLAFGNKKIIKTVGTYAKDEVMKFSDEDLTKKKRKLGKRRRSYKRRNSTFEPTISE